jgi:putative NADPH-quinone reductase
MSTGRTGGFATEVVVIAKSGSHPIVVVHYHPVETSLSSALFGQIVVNKEESVMAYSLHRNERPALAELAAARTLVLVYPTWWGGLPGAVLGWVQDTFREPFAAACADGSPIRDLERLVVVTSYGSSRLVNRINGEPGKLVLSQLLQRCTAGARLQWHACYGVDTASRGDLEDFVAGLATAVFGAGAGR